MFFTSVFAFILEGYFKSSVCHTALAAAIMIVWSPWWLYSGPGGDRGISGRKIRRADAQTFADDESTELWGQHLINLAIALAVWQLSR
jgi:hypothetical protein